MAISDKKIGAMGVLFSFFIVDAMATLYIAYALSHGDLYIDGLLRELFVYCDEFSNWIPKIRLMKCDFIENGYGDIVHVVVPVYILHMIVFLTGIFASLPFVIITIMKLKRHMIVYPTFSKERMNAMVNLVSLGSIYAPFYEFIFYSDDINAQKTRLSNLVHLNIYYLAHPIIVWMLSGIGVIFIIIRFRGKRYGIL